MLSEKSRKAIHNLQQYPPVHDNFVTSKRSAVLVPLVTDAQGELHVILTVRSTQLRTNAGDVALPGGKRDPEDVDLIATAKREALEEVQLHPNDSQVLTILHPVISRHMQVVTPVVAYCPTLTSADLVTLYPNPSEVSAIFTAPLEYFVNPPPDVYSFFDMTWAMSDHRVHRFDRCGAENYILSDQEQDLEGQESRPHTGWPVYGMTASVLIEAAKIAFQCEPGFEEHAPGQMTDVDQFTTWYNNTKIPPSHL